MAADYPLTLFYDASCPVCALEMDHLRARDRDGRLELVDISAPGFDAACHGFDHADLDAAIHAVRPDGTVLRGMRGAAPRLRRRRPRLAGPADRLRRRCARSFDAGYRVFARHRKTISRALAPAIARRVRAPCAARATGAASMNVLVCGATGCIGAAVVHALRCARPPRRRGEPRRRRRRRGDGVDFMQPRAPPADWAAALRARRIDAVVNCVGILMPSRGAELRAGARRRADRAVPRRGARRRRPRRAGVGARRRRRGRGRRSRYLHSKRARRRGPARPRRRSMPRSSARRWSTARAARARALFATLASLPVIGLPGTRRAARAADPRLELAEIVAGLVERTGSLRAASTSSAAGGARLPRHARALPPAPRASAPRSGCRCRCR